ncbi:hypothetical protein F4824DRAFT_480883, partial [Ustulina deusta]
LLSKFFFFGLMQMVACSGVGRRSARFRFTFRFPQEAKSSPRGGRCQRLSISSWSHQAAHVVAMPPLMIFSESLGCI